MVKKLFELKIEDSHHSSVELIRHIANVELSFLSMENNWTHTFIQFDRLEIKNDSTLKRVIVYNIFGHGQEIEA